jgi:hypothetical protein
MGMPAARGSHDDGGGDSTNLYIGNIAPTTTEETLNEIFSKFGEIYSVKIMWPRTDEERNRKRNCGFVSFMVRGDAADAKEAMHNAELEGYCISVGWGKAIKNLKSNPSLLGQAGGFLKVRSDALPPGLGEVLTDKLTDAIKAAKEAAAKAQKEKDEGGPQTPDISDELEMFAGKKLPQTPQTSAVATAAGVGADSADSAAAPTSAVGVAPVAGVAAPTSAVAPAFPGSGNTITGGGAPVAPPAAHKKTTLSGRASTWDVGSNTPAGEAAAAAAAAAEREMTEEDDKVEVPVPVSEERRELIDLLAHSVSKDGQVL